jgi:hypothetical protein
MPASLWPHWVSRDIATIAQPRTLGSSLGFWNVEIRITSPCPGILVISAFDVPREKDPWRGGVPVCIASITAPLTEDQSVVWRGKVHLDEYDRETHAHLWESVFSAKKKRLPLNPFGTDWTPASNIPPETGVPSTGNTLKHSVRVNLLHRITYHLSLLASAVSTLANEGRPLPIAILWQDSLIPFDPNRDDGPPPAVYPDTLAASLSFSHIGLVNSYSHWERRRKTFTKFSPSCGPLTPLLTFGTARLNSRSDDSRGAPRHQPSVAFLAEFEALREVCKANRSSAHSMQNFYSDIEEIHASGMAGNHIQVHLTKAGCTMEGSVPACLVAARITAAGQAGKVGAIEFKGPQRRAKTEIALAYASARRAYYASLAPPAGCSTWRGVSHNLASVARLGETLRLVLLAAFPFASFSAPRPNSMPLVSTMGGFEWPAVPLSLPPAVHPPPSAEDEHEDLPSPSPSPSIEEEFALGLAAAEALGSWLLAARCADKIVDRVCSFASTV